MKVLANDKITGPKMKATIPCIAKPGTSRAANHKHTPLTTSENKPRLKKLIGSDRIDSTGRIVELIPPTTTAAINAAGKLAISTPGTTVSMTSKPSAVANVVTRYAIVLLFMFLMTRSESTFVEKARF